MRTEAVEQFVTCYVHQAWPDLYVDLWDAVADFVELEPGLAPSFRSEVELLVSTRDERELRELLLDRWDSGYLAEGAGWTYREWLMAVADRVDALLDRGPHEPQITPNRPI